MIWRGLHEIGLTHLDCAELYNTEPEVGAAIKESGLPRSAFYITVDFRQLHRGPS